MVVFYENKNDGNRLKEIVSVQHEVLTPTIPADVLKTGGTTGLIDYYNSIGLSFVTVPQEPGGVIFDYNVLVDENGLFLSFSPKENL